MFTDGRNHAMTVALQPASSADRLARAGRFSRRLLRFLSGQCAGQLRACRASA
jgi:hypothetical protein